MGQIWLVLSKLLVLSIRQNVDKAIEWRTYLNKAIVFHLKLTLVFLELVITAEEGTESHSHVLNFVAILRNVVKYFAMLASEPLRASLSQYALHTILAELNDEIAYLEPFSIKLVLSKNKGPIISSPTFIFEILWV